MVRMLRKVMRITPEMHGQRFVVRKPDPQSGKSVLWFTPLALGLILVNGADVIFAVDSVPAIFAITTDTFVVYTSNIFAILGLRALYFALAAMVDRFAYLKTALAFILIFIGTKIVVADTFDLVHVPPWVSLVVTLVLLAGRRRLQPVAHAGRSQGCSEGREQGRRVATRLRAVLKFVTGTCAGDVHR